MTSSRKRTRRAPASAQAHRDEAQERNEQLRQSLKDAAAALMDEVQAGKSARLEAALRASGVRVTDVDPDTLVGDTQGWSKGKLIGLRAGLSSRNRVRTLAHEWAHEVLHQGAAALDRTASRAQREHQAEATSYVVLHHFR